MACSCQRSRRWLSLQIKRATRDWRSAVGSRAATSSFRCRFSPLTKTPSSASLFHWQPTSRTPSNSRPQNGTPVEVLVSNLRQCQHSSDGQIPTQKLVSNTPKLRELSETELIASAHARSLPLNSPINIIHSNKIC